MIKATFRVLIAGGGIGGLCLAQGLKKAGINCTVFESDASSTVRSQGYRISITHKGMASLHSVLPDELWQKLTGSLTEPVKVVYHVNEQLDVQHITQMPSAIDEVQRSGAISRTGLHDILSSGLGDRVQFGKKLTNFATLGDGRVRCHFEDGSVAEGDALVGCEGTRSVVQQNLLPKINREMTDVYALVGKIPFDTETRTHFGSAPLIDAAVVRDSQPQGMFIARHQLTQQPGPADWIFCSTIAKRVQFPDNVETLLPEELTSLAQKMTARWHPRLKNLVRRLDPESTRLFRYKTSTRPERWPVGRVTLLGDAVHNMPPTGGLGANIAMQDSALLTEALTAHCVIGKDLCDCFDEYESKMIQYAFAVVARSTLYMRSIVERDNQIPVAEIDAMFSKSQRVQEAAPVSLV